MSNAMTVGTSRDMPKLDCSESGWATATLCQEENVCIGAHLQIHAGRVRQTERLCGSGALMWSGGRAPRQPGMRTVDGRSVRMAAPVRQRHHGSETQNPAGEDL